MMWKVMSITLHLLFLLWHKVYICNEINIIVIITKLYIVSCIEMYIIVGILHHKV
jgi:hypothetical protein